MSQAVRLARRRPRQILLLFALVLLASVSQVRSQDVAAGTKLAVSTLASDGFLNMRTEPDPESAIVTRLTVGSEVAATGRIAKHRHDVWYQVRVDRKTGWVNAYYLEQAARIHRAPEVASYQSDGLEDEGTRWILKGSTFVLTIEDDMWIFRYLDPRPGMVEEGVRRGTILFKGREYGYGLTGTAYRFSKRCGVLPYEVSGDFEPDGSLTLTGTGARGLDRACNTTQTEHYTLEFQPMR
ncbi:MAG: SH3 domain-containing protein [Hyphomicrobiaceae bacterium]